MRDGDGVADPLSPGCLWDRPGGLCPFHLEHEARRSQGTREATVKSEPEDEAAQVPSCSHLIKSKTLGVPGSQLPPAASPLPASPGLSCLPLMKVLLHKAARYVLSLFQLFICLLGCSFPLVSATLL